MMVSNRGNCWQVAQHAAAFRSDALMDDIRVSICVDNSIAPSNPLLTVRAHTSRVTVCAPMSCRVPLAVFSRQRVLCSRPPRLQT